MSLMNRIRKRQATFLDTHYEKKSLEYLITTSKQEITGGRGIQREKTNDRLAAWHKNENVSSM